MPIEVIIICILKKYIKIYVSNVAFMLAFHQNRFINECARKKIAKITFDVITSIFMTVIIVI